MSVLSVQTNFVCCFLLYAAGMVTIPKAHSTTEGPQYDIYCDIFLKRARSVCIKLVCPFNRDN